MFTLSLEHPYDGKRAPDVGADLRVCPRRAGTQAPPLRYAIGVFEEEAGDSHGSGTDQAGS